MFIETKKKATGNTIEHNELLTAEEFNQLVQEDLNLIRLTDTPDVNKTNQLSLAVQKISSNILYKDIGFKNSVILQRDGISNTIGHFKGFSGFFKPKYENDDITTMCVDGYDAVPLKYKDIDLDPGFLNPDETYMFYYNGEYFEISYLSSSLNSTATNSIINAYDQLLPVINGRIKTTYPVVNDLIGMVLIFDKDDKTIIIGEVKAEKIDSRTFSLGTNEFDGHYATVNYLKLR